MYEKKKTDENYFIQQVYTVTMCIIQLDFMNKSTYFFFSSLSIKKKKWIFFLVQYYFSSFFFFSLRKNEEKEFQKRTTHSWLITHTEFDYQSNDESQKYRYEKK